MKKLSLTNCGHIWSKCVPSAYYIYIAAYFGDDYDDDDEDVNYALICQNWLNKIIIYFDLATENPKTQQENKKKLLILIIWKRKKKKKQFEGTKTKKNFFN